MKKNLIVFVLALFAGAVIFTGCAKKVVKTEVGEGVEIAGPEGAQAGGEEAGEAYGEGRAYDRAGTGTAGTEGAEATEAAVEIEDIFFDFDRYNIRPDARAVLEKNAKILLRDKSAKVLIEGHCDERGTNEYNIALGERRARAAKRYLVNLGVDPDRISIVSYGEERPFCTEHNEQCWQKNRRAHFVISY